MGGQPQGQAEEIGQFLLAHPLLVDGQDVAALFRLEQEVRVLNAFGDALERHRRSKVEVGEKGGKLLVGDVGIDGHGGAGMRERGRPVKST